MNEALDDEYEVIAIYERVIADFGPVRPFLNIVEAERRHVEALRRLFDRNGLTTPTNWWPDRAPRYDSTAQACAAGTAGEIENAAMCDRLIAVSLHRDVIDVFENLRHASQDQHLPAFQRCSDRGDGGAEPG